MSAAAAYFLRSSASERAWYFWGFWVPRPTGVRALISSCPVAIALAFASLQGRNREADLPLEQRQQRRRERIPALEVALGLRLQHALHECR